MKKFQNPKYDVSTTVRCPLCEDDVQVGTAGPQGLEQHQGKKKCLASMAKKKQNEQRAKNHTLCAISKKISYVFQKFPFSVQHTLFLAGGG
jgi:hypothetical protein